MIHRLIPLLAATTLAASAPQSTSIAFEDVTEAAGIAFTNVFGSASKEHISEVNGSGAAFLDYDRDGDPDLYLVNGSRTRTQSSGSGQGPGDALYRNDGDGTFTDVTAAAGVGDRGWGLGVVSADYDNDGWPDLYITNYGPNTLYRNNGDGTFTDVTARAGVGDAGYGTGAAFADYDRDGWLDLYVANYMAVGGAEPEEACGYKGVPVFCGPGGFSGGQNILYRNNGDGTFSDRTSAAGLDDAEVLYTFAAVFEDFNGDGWPDLFLANDSAPNSLFENTGDGRFREVGLLAGVAYSEDGRAQAGMGVAVGDYNGDGRPDLVVTNFSDDYNTVYRNDGDMLFSDQSSRVGLAQPSIPMLGWGVLLEDFDNDGQPDVMVANGHIYPQVDAHDIGTHYRQPLQLFRNRGDRFEEVERPVPAGLDPLAARGLAAADIDNDGDLDVVVNQIDGPAILLANRTDPDRTWLVVELEGSRSNRSAVGAVVRVRVDGRDHVRTVRAGGSYLSHSDSRLHFGLGEAASVEQVEVRWPSGAVSTLDSVEPRQMIVVREAPEK